jgi:protein-disulfide isomerase
MEILMFKNLIGGTLVALCTMSTAAFAQMADSQWNEVRGYLERNEDALSQVMSMMDREIVDDQAALDAAFIAEHSDAIFNDTMSPVLGNPDGTVTVVKFTDFRCGYCRLVTPELHKLMESDDRVKVIIKEFPILGQDSIDMAGFALAAYSLGGSEAYAAVQEEFFSHKGHLTKEYLAEVAASVNLDVDEVFATAQLPEIEAEIRQTFSLADGLKINGTPGLIIKDFVVRGSIPFETMQLGISEIYAE